jgi:hypothetical protein
VVDGYVIGFITANKTALVREFPNMFDGSIAEQAVSISIGRKNASWRVSTVGLGRAVTPPSR